MSLGNPPRAYQLPLGTRAGQCQSRLLFPVFLRFLYLCAVLYPNPSRGAASLKPVKASWDLNGDWDLLHDGRQVSHHTVAAHAFAAPGPGSVPRWLTAGHSDPTRAPFAQSGRC